MFWKIKSWGAKSLLGQRPIRLANVIGGKEVKNDNAEVQDQKSRFCTEKCIILLKKFRTDLPGLK